jgi:hypothetical protein
MKFYGIQNEVKAYINRLQDENGIFVSASDIKTINDRVESLKRSGDWSRFSLGFNDVDGDAYLARAGVTNPLGRCEVLWFVRGMKALDLWRSMVCWPMRNYQNIGTGSTVYSLGGLSAFNGTTVNSPTWGVDGFNFFNTAQYISTTATSNQPMCIFSVHKINNNTTTSRLWDSISDQLLSITANTLTLQAGSTTLQTVGTISLSSWFTSQVEFNGASGNASLNGVSKTTRNFGTANLTGGLRIGSLSVSQFGRECSFAMLLRERSSVQLLHNLYKSTLGNGLGLP